MVVKNDKTRAAAINHHAVPPLPPSLPLPHSKRKRRDGPSQGRQTRVRASLGAERSSVPFWSRGMTVVRRVRRLILGRFPQRLLDVFRADWAVHRPARLHEFVYSSVLIGWWARPNATEKTVGIGARRDVARGRGHAVRKGKVRTNAWRYIRTGHGCRHN